MQYCPCYWWSVNVSVLGAYIVSSQTVSQIENLITLISFARRCSHVYYSLLLATADDQCQAQSNTKCCCILEWLSSYSSYKCSEAMVETSCLVCSEGSGCICFMKSFLTSNWFRYLQRKCRFQAEGFWKHNLSCSNLEPGVLLWLEWKRGPVLDRGSGLLPALQVSVITQKTCSVHSVVHNVMFFTLV